MRKILKSLKTNLNNIPGWRTNRKIIVIESDDWGSIRMPSKQVYKKLLNAGVRVDQCAFTKFDALASEQDLSSLFDMLSGHRDKNGKPPVITANCILANPDFEKIKNSGFKEYFYELFPQTLKRYPNHGNSFIIMKEGIRSGYFYPQLHGREHLYVQRWLKYLQMESPETKLAFDNEMFGISSTITTENRRSFLPAYDFENKKELENQKKILQESQVLFENLFGFKSKSFIAPNYIWSIQIEPYLKEIGIEFIQSSKKQILPTGAKGEEKARTITIGDVNELNQTFLVRNCIFEPSVNVRTNSVSSCLAQIEASFRWKKPAIISSHRLNYIGFIEESNRDRGLSELNELLIRIKRKWPDIEFMHSSELGELIKRKS